MTDYPHTQRPRAAQPLGLNSVALIPALLKDQSKPLLLLVVDTEEEFDWTQPFSSNNRSVSWIRRFREGHAAFIDAGLRPTYVVDYPVASTASSVDIFSKIADSGDAEIGAHLHPWVTPPTVEIVNYANSYAGNLPESLEFAKLCRLRDAIRSNIGVIPTTYKAGRYGIAPRTPAMLARLGFTADLSTSPGFDWSGDGGPNHLNASNLPRWIPGTQAILEIPTTGGFFGPLRRLGPSMYPTENCGVRDMSVLRWIARKSNLARRAMLTPEGYSLRDLQALTETLADDGVRVFSLSFHSPSLSPGNTPFVRNDSDLALFIDVVISFASWFDRRFFGRFVTASQAREAHHPVEETILDSIQPSIPT